MLCISKVVHNSLIRRLNQKLLGFVFPWWVFCCLQYCGSSFWHCAVCCHPLLYVRSGPEPECSPPASYFPRTYILCIWMWAFRTAILRTSVKISAGYCKAVDSGDSPPSVIVPAGASLFICTTSGWCDLRQRGRCYFCRNRSCWSGRL